MKQFLEIFTVIHVFLIFGIILISMLTTDMIHANKLSNYPKGWLLNRHISLMMGAFIAILPGFLVQNSQTDTIFISRLLLTAFFVPLIIYFTKKFKVTLKLLKPHLPIQNS